MIKVKLRMQPPGKPAVELHAHSIRYGENGSFTDYGPAGTHIIVVECLADRGEVHVSKAGTTAEIGSLRIVNSANYTKEAEFTDKHQRMIKTRIGIEAVILLEFEKEIIN